MTNTKLASGRCEISQNMEKAHEIAAINVENHDWTTGEALNYVVDVSEGRVSDSRLNEAYAKATAVYTDDDGAGYYGHS